jgi:hypothetical protein
MPLSDDLKSQKHERLIGAIAVRWTQVENSIQRMFCVLAGLDARTGLCISQHMSFQALQNAILTICHETPKYKTNYPKVKAILDNADKLRVERNNQIHALWGMILYEGAPKVVQGNEVTGLVIKARGKLSTTVLHTTLEKIGEIVESIEKCREEVDEFTRDVFGDIRLPDDET